MDITQLQRLERLRALLPDDRVDGPPKSLLFARAGFTGELGRRRAGGGTWSWWICTGCTRANSSFF